MAIFGRAYPIKAAIWIGRPVQTAAVAGPHPVGKITRLGYEGYGVRRAGSFAGKAGVTAGRVKVWDGSAWVIKPTKVWDGSAWVTKPTKVWNGSAWV